MVDGQVRRRLAAILAADVAGYSRLMGDDERATIACLRDYRAVFQEMIEGNGGRVVDMAGDSVLAAFDSAAGAVETAVETQAELAKRNEALPEHRRMQFRIGVNLGDIEEADNGTVYGDGVNVAARLEAMASPGGINVSGSVFDSVRARLDLPFDFLGEHEVKNIADPVRAYRVGGDDGSARNPSLFRRRFAAGVTALAGLVILVGIWWLAGSDDTGVSPTNSDVRVDDWPSLIVRPLEVLSDDDDLVHFTRALNTEISNGLSLFSDLRVVPHNATSPGKSNFVLEGTVQRGPEKVRVVVALLDGKSGNKAWGRTYEEAIENTDLLAVQSQIASRVVSNVADPFGAIPNATSGDLIARSGRALLGNECTAFARFAYAYGATEEVHNRARDCLEKLTSRDPDDAEAWAWLSIIYVDEAAFAFPGREGFDELAAAFRAARKSLALSPRHEISLTALGQAHFLAKDYERALVVSEQAATANPFNSLAVGWAGSLLAFAGDWDRGLAAIDRARTINGEAPAWIIFPYIWYHILRDEYAEAARYAQEATRDWNHPFSHAALATSYAHLGRSREARLSAARIRELDPAYVDYAEGVYELWFPDDGPWPGLKDRIMTGLDKAGLFEDPNATKRPVIAVLPFDNLSGDPEQEYFADGITEDIITRIAQYQEMGVIARNSSFQYKGRAVDLRKVGEELGADYVLEGSVRSAGNTIRIVAQLIGTADGTHLWAETFDRPLSADDIFAVQDEITQQVVSLVADRFGVVMQELYRSIPDHSPTQMSSYECVLRAAHYQMNITEENYYRARECLDEVTASDPTYADPWAYRAEVYTDGHLIWLDPAVESLDQPIAFANRAISLSPEYQYGHFALAYAYFAKGEIQSFLDEAEQAVELNPNNAAMVGSLGAFIAAAGRWESGIDLVNQAIKLNPNFPAWINYVLAADNLRTGNLAAAVKNGQDYTARIPDYYWAHVIHAMALGASDRPDDAAKHVTIIRELNPDFESNATAEWQKWIYDDEVLAILVESLRKAGMAIPEPVN